jgi:OmpA-OmpF porin, OOP family
MRCFCALLVLAQAPAARAQSQSSVDLQGFRPAMDASGLFTLDTSRVLQPGRLSFGLVTSWANNVLRLASESAVYEVRHLVSPVLVGAVGVNAFGLPAQVGLSVPFTLVAGDRDPDDPGDPANPNDDRQFHFTGQGLGNVGIHGKVPLAGSAAYGVGLVGALHLPAPDQSGPWLGAGGMAATVRGVVDGRLGPLRVAVNGGARWRARTNRFSDIAGPMTAGEPVTGQTVAVRNALPFGVGLSYALGDGAVDLIAELFGEVPLGGQNYGPLEAVAGVKVYLARHSYLSLGGGAGLRSAGAAPDARAFVGIVFEVHAADRDGDGIADRADQCPNEPEDRDGWQDSDGCPELDNDGDGWADQDDGCPDQPERKNGYRDDDGCPDRDAVIDVGTELVVLEEIHFEYNQAVIAPESHPIVDAVGAVLLGNPAIELVEIQGHTDDRGSAAYNQALSERRAAAVREYLVSYGVHPERLIARGYGESQPVVVGTGEAAWATNRRVQFVILRRTGEP